MLRTSTLPSMQRSASAAFGSSILATTRRQMGTLTRPMAVSSSMRRLTSPSQRQPSGVASTVAPLEVMSHRSVTWQSMWNLITFTPERETLTQQSLQQDLPSVFERNPEVEDYIRPERTFFEKLEDWWDWIIGFMSPVEKQMEWMRGFAHGGLLGFDIGWGGTFVLYGVILRLISLGPMLYAHRNTLRISRIQPALSEIQQQQKRINNDKSITSAERRVLKDGYKRMQKALYAKHNCSQLRTMVGSLSSPLMITALLGIRRLAAYEDELEKSSFLWVHDLSMPDPLTILPVLCAGLFLSNFELNSRLQRGGRSTLQMYIRWGMRVVVILVAWFFRNEPSAVFCYWIGLSTAGILQPIILRWTWFREMFGFPEIAKTAKELDAEGPFAKLWRKIRGKEEPAEFKVKVDEKKVVEDFKRIHDFDVVLDDDEDGKAKSKRH